MASPAAAALNCDDFPNQAAAQAFLRADPTDPEGLDGNNDGVACESLPAPKDLVPVDRDGPSSEADTAPALVAAAAVTQGAVNDQDCGDFSSQAAAQAHLDADKSDPDNLDADNDGKACEAFFRTADATTATARVVPASTRTALPQTGSPGSTRSLVLLGTSLVLGGAVLARYGLRRVEERPVWVVLAEVYADR